MYEKHQNIEVSHNIPEDQHQNINKFLEYKNKQIQDIFKLKSSDIPTFKKYFNQIKSNNYRINDIYKKSKCGRIYGKGTTIQKLPNKLRGLILGNSAYDIDIKNCAWNVIKYIIKSEYFEHQTKFKTIIDYAENREKYFENNFDKLEWIKILFSENPKKLNQNYYSDPIKDLINEIQELHDLIKDNLHRYSHIEFNDKKNNFNSKLSYIVFNQENIILNEIMEKYKEMVIAPIFDGVIISSDCNLENALTDINNIVSKYELSVHYKEFPEIKLDDNPPGYDNDYLLMKEEFEENHFMIEDSPIIFVRITYNSKGEREVRYYNKKDFSDLVQPFQFDNKSFFNEWLKDPKRKSYKKIEWCPNINNINEDCFNPFNGFKSKILEEDEIDINAVNIFLEHLKLLVDYNEKSLDYLKKYIAHLFQRPEELPLVALLFKSSEGVGKDIFLTILSNIIGRDLVNRDSKFENITGTFNKNLKNKLIIQLNEVKSKDGHENKDLLKDLITIEELNIRVMRTDTRTEKNYCRFILFTNNLTPISINRDNRRYVIFQCGEKKEPEYYNGVFGISTNPNSLSSIFSYFMNIDISKFTPFGNFIRTQAAENLEDNNKEPFYEFLYEICLHPLKYDIIQNKQNESCLSWSSINHHYGIFLEDNYPSNCINEKLLKKLLLHLKQRDAKFYKNQKQVRGFILNIPQLKNILEKNHGVEKSQVTYELKQDFKEYD